MNPEQYEIIKAAWNSGAIYDSGDPPGNIRINKYTNRIITSNKFDKETNHKYIKPIPIEEFIDLYLKYILRTKP